VRADDDGSTNNPVAPVVLGEIELLICRLEQVGGGHRHITCGAGNADADGEFHRGRFEAKYVVRDGFAYPLGNSRATLKGCFHQDQHKLFPPVTGEEVFLANGIANDIGEFPENEVPTEMAERIVDRLELVDIEHEDRKRSGVSLGADDFAFEEFRQVALVMNPRETIEDGQPVNLLVVLGFDVPTGR